MCSETKKSEGIILEKPSYFIHIHPLAQLNSLVQAVWHACFWNSVEANTNLQRLELQSCRYYRQKVCIMWLIWWCCCQGSVLLSTTTLVSGRRNWELHVLFIEDPNPIFGDNDWGWELVITTLSYLIVSILIWCFHGSDICTLQSAIL